MKENEFDINEDNILKTLEIYESEWMHRDNALIKEINTAFYAALICNVAPFLLQHYEIESLDSVIIVFPIIGIFITIYFYFLSMAYSARLDAIGESIEKLIKLLPEELKRIKVEKTKLGKFKFVNTRIALWSPLCMFNALFILDFSVLDFWICSYYNLNGYLKFIIFLISSICIVFALISSFYFLNFSKESND